VSHAVVRARVRRGLLGRYTVRVRISVSYLNRNFVGPIVVLVNSFLAPSIDNRAALPDRNLTASFCPPTLSLLRKVRITDISLRWAPILHLVSEINSLLQPHPAAIA